ncbi:MAG: glycosyltransferase family 2 protein [bacterium]
MEKVAESSSTQGTGRSAPLVSVVTVNHNGGHLLPDLLESLRRQSYTNHEVVVVDNASRDDSRNLLRNDFPEVRVIEQDRNLGFAEGNNLGIRAAHGSLVALANNDTVADPRWLEELVRTALGDDRIGAVASKILFLRPFVPLRLVAERSGMLFGEATGFVACDYDKAIFKTGFHGAEASGSRRVRRMAEEGTVLLPIPAAGGGGPLRLVVATGELAPPQRLRIEIGARPIATLTPDHELREHLVEVPAEVLAAESFDVINNAGTDLSAFGDAADRGIFEPDTGQYEREEDLAAFCGAAVLLGRSALEEVGLFDRDFFMYYEDTDLSWRLRRAGYRIRYQPRSTIRHRHAASSVEWSPLFTFYTARNRVLMIAKNGGPAAFPRAYGRELRTLAGLGVRVGRARRGPAAAQVRRELLTRFRVHGSLFVKTPRTVLQRTGLIADRIR